MSNAMRIRSGLALTLSFSVALLISTPAQAEICPICGQDHLTGAEISEQVNERMTEQQDRELDRIDSEISDQAQGIVDRVGPVLTDEQEAQLLEALKTGDTATAQALIASALGTALAQNPPNPALIQQAQAALGLAPGIAAAADAQTALRDAVENGAPLADVEQAAADLDTALQAMPGGGAGLGGAIDTVVGLEEAQERVADILSLLTPTHVIVPSGGAGIGAGAPGGVAGGGAGAAGGFGAPSSAAAYPLYQGVPVEPGLPVADAPAPVSGVAESGTVLLINPLKNAGPVSFSLAGGMHTAAAGAAVEVAIAGRDVIAFDRGNRLGQARYTVTQALSYEFTATPDKGWDMRQKKFAVTISNRDSTQDFHFLLDGAPQTIAAGNSREFKGDRPLSVVFDRGDGKEPMTKLLSDGVYNVGVDREAHLLNLFRADPAATQTAASDPSSPPAPPAS
jgi:hypothetical protein